MPDCSLGAVVGTRRWISVSSVSSVGVARDTIERRFDLDGNYLRLWLRHVNNSARHASDKDHATGGLAGHQVLGDSDGEQVCAVYVDAPQLTHAINGVVDSIEVLSESSAGDEVVNLAVLLDDVVDAALNRVRIRHIGEVSGDLGDLVSTGVLLAEDLDELDSLALGLLLCRVGKNTLASCLR